MKSGMHLFTLTKANSRAASAPTSAFALRLRGIAELLELLTQSLAFGLGLGFVVGQMRPATFFGRFGALAVRKLVAVNSGPASVELLLV